MSAEPAVGASRAAAWASLALFVAVVGLTAALSAQPRVAALQHMREHAAAYYATGGLPAAGADAYLWLRLARGLREGWLRTGERDPLRSYPDGRLVERVPALARVLAWSAAPFGGDVYRAAGALMVVLSSLFVVPLCAFCRTAGVPAAGVVGALVASFSPAYYERTTPVFVDTDGGNQLFVWLVPALLAGVSPERGRGRNRARVALAGLALQGFCWWYHQLGFWPVYVAVAGLYLAVSGLGRREAGLLLAVFALAANPFYAVGAVANLAELARGVLLPASGVAGDASLGPLTFAGLTAEIEELARPPLSAVLADVAARPVPVVAGIAGFALFALRRPRLAVLLLPQVALGVLAFTTSQRFAMYLAPLVGVGLGTLLALVVQRALRRRPLLGEAASFAAAFGAVLLLLEATAWGRLPRPTVPARLLESLVALRGEVPAGAPISHSFTFGYAIAEAAGLATFNDGEWPDPVVEQLQSRALTSDDPEELRAILAWLAATERERTVDLFVGGLAYDEALARLRAARPQPLRAPYLIFTERGVREFVNYYRKGQWDFAAKRGPLEGYDVQRCRRDGRRLLCEKPGSGQGRAVVDLAAGTINGQPGLGKFVRIREGRAVEELDYPGAGSVYAQLVEPAEAGVYLVQFLREPVFRSNFNQLYMLGRFDPAAFELVHDDFPVARVYRVRPPPPGSS